jgi:S-adenosylmethionine decarboxylase
MTRIIRLLFKYSGLKPEDWGLGVVLIAETRQHSPPRKNFVSVDIFSCKAFDAELAETYLKKAFQMAKVETNMLDRGTEFPKEINGAARIVRADRRRVARPAASRHA